MSIAYTSHMVDTFYDPIYFFNDPFLYEAKLTSEALFNFRIVKIFTFV